MFFRVFFSSSSGFYVVPASSYLPLPYAIEILRERPNGPTPTPICSSFEMNLSFVQNLLLKQLKSEEITRWIAAECIEPLNEVFSICVPLFHSKQLEFHEFKVVFNYHSDYRVQKCFREWFLWMIGSSDQPVRGYVMYIICDDKRLVI